MITKYNNTDLLIKNRQLEFIDKSLILIHSQAKNKFILLQNKLHNIMSL